MPSGGWHRTLTARGAVTRARIVDAAASLVYERGFAASPWTT